MDIQFVKMHGLGNDFVVIDAISQAVNLDSDKIRFIADRHFGIGCDQVLLVERSTNPEVDFRYRIFNADGGEVEQCGNGARCFARFVLEKGLTDKNVVVVETNSGIIHLKSDPDGQVTVNMGNPQFEPSVIPISEKNRATIYQLMLEDRQLEIGAVSMGNPHAVLVVEDVSAAPVATLGALLEKHPMFPQKVNVGFMEVVDRTHIKLRVYERGVGETMACGTGACAAVVIGCLRGLLENQVYVDLPGGRLLIRWDGENTPVWMTGPATFVFEGTIKL